MRNPIFSIDTLFLDRHDDGTIHYVLGDKTKNLSCGGKLIRLETRQPLVELSTESGQRLVMAPETAFALQTGDNGALTRYLPVDDACAQWTALINFSAHPADDDVYLRFYLAGLMCAAGRHSYERNRPSNIAVPPKMENEIVEYLNAKARLLVSQGILYSSPRIFPSVTPENLIFIKSRVLTHMVGKLLTDKTQVPAFEMDGVKRPELWAFCKGVLDGSPRVAGKIVFTHRHAAVVTAIHGALWRIFGVMASLDINPMEAEVTRHKTWGTMPNQMRLSAEDRAYATAAGLDTFESNPPKLLRPDRILRVTPEGTKTLSVIVLPGRERKYPLTANTFIFHPQFSLPEALVDLAAHPALSDSGDPTIFEETPP